MERRKLESEAREKLNMKSYDDLVDDVINLMSTKELEEYVKEE